MAQLLAILKITKQSLARVLNDLLDGGYVERRPGARRPPHAPVAPDREGPALEAALWEAQRPRVVRAFRDAGPEAVAGFRRVLLALSGEARGTPERAP